jgi:alcohol dehydrogenase class IV
VGEAGHLARDLAGLGSRIFLVTGKNSSRHDHVLAGVPGVTGRATIEGEPTIERIDELVGYGRIQEVDVVVGVGGGSVLDTAKALAALVPNLGPPLHYLEVVGDGAPLEEAALPTVLIPTTAGTGSEMTRNAVLTSRADRQKVSLRHQSMLARLAIVDPLMTVSCPPTLTAACGLDALTQCIEPFVSRFANPLTDAIALSGIRRGAASLQTAFDDSSDIDARTNVAWMSVAGGIALANAKLGVVHGLAGPLGGTFSAAHGDLCGALLPSAFDVNARAAAARGGSEIVKRFDAVAQAVTGDDKAVALDGAAWLADLVSSLGVKPLGDAGVTSASFDDLIERSLVSSSMAGNPVDLTEDELREVLERAV